MLRSEWVGLDVDDRYTLLEWLGSTSAGDAFLTSLPEGRRAALLLATADPANAQDQLRNWQVAIELDHPHLLRALACGRTDIEGIDCLYLVTELPEESLAEILPDRALSGDEAREMLAPVLDALAHLHQRNLLHGRLDPANILVAEGRLKLATHSVRPVGSLCGFDEVLRIYDAPESKSEPLSPAADIWSLGVTLIEGLTQAPPAWMRSSGRNPLIADTVPQPFADIARKCLRLDPAHRCTVAEITALLQPPAGPDAPPPVAEMFTTAQLEPEPQPKSTAEPPAQAASLPVQPQSRPQQAKPKQATPAPRQIPLFEASDPIAAAPPSDAASQPFRRSLRGIDDEEKIALDPKKYLQIGAVALVLLVVLLIGWATYHRKGSKAPMPEQTTLAAPPAAAPAQKSVEPARPRPHGPSAKGEVLSRLLPEIPARASRGIHGKVEVKLKLTVDHTGNVINAAITSEDRSRFFAQKSAEAARKWKFKPARTDGRPTSSVWNVRFEFRKAHTSATAVQVTP